MGALQAAFVSFFKSAAAATISAAAEGLPRRISAAPMISSATRNSLQRHIYDAGSVRQLSVARGAAAVAGAGQRQFWRAVARGGFSHPHCSMCTGSRMSSSAAPSFPAVAFTTRPPARSLLTAVLARRTRGCQEVLPALTNPTQSLYRAHATIGGRGHTVVRRLSPVSFASPSSIIVRGFATGRFRFAQNPLGAAPSTTGSVSAARTAGATHKEKSKAMVYYLLAITVGMVGLTYLSVPLYRMFCQATGFGGTTQRRETIEEKVARQKNDGSIEDATAGRGLTIHFNADVSDGLQWKFTPCQRELKLHPGEPALAFYTAHNLSDQPITGVSTYNVSPMKAGVYFNKIQCFCFEEQRLRAHEKIDMPVFFYIDPDLLKDRRMDDVDSITLSYTFFKVNDGDGALGLPPEAALAWQKQQEEHQKLQSKLLAAR